MKDAKAEKNLVINLRRAEGSGALDANSNLFEDEMNVVLAWVNKHRGVMAAQTGDNKRHQHDAILISGPRGSGKTTFMYTLKDRIGRHSEMGHSVALLEPLDPSLIDGDDIFLATIMARIFGHLKEAKKEENKGDTKALKHNALTMLVLAAQASRKNSEAIATLPALFGERLGTSLLSNLTFADRVRSVTRTSCSRSACQPTERSDHTRIT